MQNVDFGNCLKKNNGRNGFLICELKNILEIRLRADILEAKD